MKICAGSLGNSCVRICKVWCMAIISAYRIFCNPISFWGRFIFSSGFHMPYLACVESHIPLACCFGGVNEPSI